MNNRALDTIAHEIWHAHQYSVVDEYESSSEANPCAELYKTGIDDYVSSGENLAIYRKQLIEIEASEFAKAILDETIQLYKRIYRAAMASLYS